MRTRRSPLRPRSTHTPAMPSDATGGWPCLHPPCVSSRAHHPAHHPAHYIAHGHMQRRAYMRALAHVYMRNVAYAHSTSLTRHTCAPCAHAHAHSQTDRFTHRDGISQERLTQTHTCTHMQNTYAHTVAYIHTYTHENTQTHKSMRSFKHIHNHTHAHTHSCTRTQKHTQRERKTGYHMNKTHTYTNVDTYRHTHKHLHTHMHAHTHT